MSETCTASGSRADADPLVMRTITNLEQRWAGADREALRPFFRYLARGRAVSVDRLAAEAALDPARVDTALRSGPIGRDDSGSLTELFGYKLDPGWHRVEHDGRSLWACCALVAHAVPRLLGTAVAIESVDPVSRRVVRVSVGESGLETVQPADAVATFALAYGPWDNDDLAAAFCSHIRHFADRAAADEFAAADRRRRVVDVSTFDTLVAEVTRRVWGV